MVDVRTHNVTGLLVDWRRRDEGSLQKLMPLVHEELRRIAMRHMAGERPDHVLQTTALVNEVYLRLVDVRRMQWQDRAHFFAMGGASDAPRARRHRPAQRNQKRGGALQRVRFDQNLPVASETPENVIAIDEALRSLAAADERKARVVELRFFVGMSVQETAHVREISQKRVMRDWRFAKNWLMRELSRQGTAGTR